MEMETNFFKDRNKTQRTKKSLVIFFFKGNPTHPLSTVALSDKVEKQVYPTKVLSRFRKFAYS